MLYNSVFQRLNQRKIKYAAVGGIATAFHGNTSFTLHLDLVADNSPRNIQGLRSVFEKLGYKPSEKSDRISFFSARKPLGMVNVFIERFSDRRKIKRAALGEIKVPIFSRQSRDEKNLANNFSKEYLVYCLRVTPQERLNRLGAALHFLQMALPFKARRRWIQRIKKGE